jgi:hypothetical protein
VTIRSRINGVVGLGIERCGKRNVSNSGAERWTGIGGVAGVGAVVLIM